MNALSRSGETKTLFQESWKTAFLSSFLPHRDNIFPPHNKMADELDVEEMLEAPFRKDEVSLLRK